MKFLAVFLTLVIFAGSRAGPVSETPQQEGGIQDYVRRILNTTQEGWDSLRNLQQGQEFVALFTNFSDSLSSFSAEVQKVAEKLGVDVNPSTEELRGKIDLVLKEVLLAPLRKVQEGLSPYAEDVMETLRHRLAFISGEVDRSVEQIPERLLELLSEDQKRQVLELSQKMKKQFHSRLRQTKQTAQQFGRKLFAWAEAWQNRYPFSDLRSQINNLGDSLFQ